jgi:hypothetical protein
MGGGERRSLLPLAALAAVLAVALALGWYASRMVAGAAAVEGTVEWFRELVASRPLVALGVALPAVVLAALFGLSRLLRA